MAADPMGVEVIREVLAEEPVCLRAGAREERVRIAGDADLATFANTPDATESALHGPGAGEG